MNQPPYDPELGGWLDKLSTEKVRTYKFEPGTGNVANNAPATQPLTAEPPDRIEMVRYEGYQPGQLWAIFVWRSHTPGAPNLAGHWPVIEVTQGNGVAKYQSNFASGPHVGIGESLTIICRMDHDADLMTAIVYAVPIEGGTVGWTEE
jgi:hypothetical protein